MSPFVLNTYLTLGCAILVMWMAAGFTMLEAGSVSSKNASVICLKNLCLYAVAGAAYYAVGYHLMYTDVDQWYGVFGRLYAPTAHEMALLAGRTGGGAGGRRTPTPRRAPTGSSRWSSSPRPHPSCPEPSPSG